MHQERLPCRWDGTVQQVTWRHQVLHKQIRAPLYFCTKCRMSCHSLWYRVVVLKVGSCFSNTSPHPFLGTGENAVFELCSGLPALRVGGVEPSSLYCFLYLVMFEIHWGCGIFFSTMKYRFSVGFFSPSNRIHPKLYIKLLFCFF